MMTQDSCYTRNADGELVTAHAHFEGRCVTDTETDRQYAARLAAYLDGGWSAWNSIYALQRERGLM